MKNRMRSAEETILSSMTEGELGAWFQDQGYHVTQHLGRYWQHWNCGIFLPLHWMARMSDEEAVRPEPYCLGFRTTLSEDDAHLANGTLPVHLISDPGGYDLQSVGSRQRNKIRRGLKEVQVVELLEPDLLLEQGHEVYNSALARTGYGISMSTEEYERRIRGLFLGRGVVLGGLIEGRLAGYLTSFAVNGTAYLKELYLHSGALSSQIGSALGFTMLQICSRSAQIREVVNSPHMPENEGLSRHKEQMGFSVVHIPSRIWFAPLMKELLIKGYVRRSRPHAFYRLYGRY